jgi:UDP-N-acetyl-D-glucosamine dehydrogenase
LRIAFASVRGPCHPNARAPPVPTAARQLSTRIDQHTAHLSVVGLGYVGLPLAVEFGKAGFKVTGIDTDDAAREGAPARRFVHPDVPTADVKSLVDSGQLEATTDFAALKRWTR